VDFAQKKDGCQKGVWHPSSWKKEEYEKMLLCSAYIDAITVPSRFIAVLRGIWQVLLCRACTVG
jgi:hypothetical protein